MIKSKPETGEECLRLENCTIPIKINRNGHHIDNTAVKLIIPACCIKKPIPKTNSNIPIQDLLDIQSLPHFYHKSDRKSTRLNSSHVAISYAVFCLKKKT